MDKTQLTSADRDRYSRHLLLPEVGEAGQLRLKRAKVLVVGAGGLGAPVLLYLAAAGVGTIGIVDDDVIDLSNLQRQVLYTEADVGKLKTAVARERIAALNALVQVVAHGERFGAKNAIELVSQYDLVLDGTDNFATRYMINDACILAGKPNVHAAIFRFEGQVSVFGHDGGPCYRCIFPEMPAPHTVPNCADAGVLGVMAGTVGTLQCAEAIKILLGKGSTLSGKLAIFNAMETTLDTLQIKRNRACSLCGEAPTIKTVRDQSFHCETTKLDSIKQLSAEELRKLLKDGASVSSNNSILLDVRNDNEWHEGHLDNAVHIPLPHLPSRLTELQKQARIIVYCRSGARSMTAAQLLIEHGFEDVTNLTGGILAWNELVG